MIKSKKIILEVISQGWPSFIELIGLISGSIGILQMKSNLLSFLFLSIILISVVVVGFRFYKIWESINLNAYPTKESINHFMYRWLKDNGQSVVLSRDMSWASEKKITEMLKEKAKKNELTLILSFQNNLSKELEKLGAVIIEYGYLDFIPETRFTIVDYGSLRSKVAIGQKDEMEIHRINKYIQSDIPVYYLVNDLIKLVQGIEKNRMEKIEKN